MKNFKGRNSLYGILFIALCLTMSLYGSANAETTLVSHTAVVSSTVGTLSAKAIDPIKIQELGKTGHTNPGYLTLKISKNVQLSTIAKGDITKDSDTLGGASAPNDLFVKNVAVSSGLGTLYFKDSEGSDVDVLYTYSSASSAYTNLAKYNTLEAFPSSDDKVGEIYLNADNETVISLGFVNDPDETEQTVLSGICLKPTTKGSTGDVTISIAGGKSDGTGGDFVTDGSVKVMTLTNQPASVTKDSGTLPTIPAGAVGAQPMGAITIEKVGNSADTTDDNKITIALDNGAKFHHTAATTTTWIKVDSLSIDASKVDIDDNGRLVINMGSGSITEGTKIVLDHNADVIDASNITEAGDINATVTGTKGFEGLSETVKVANTALKGASVSFNDNDSGFQTLYLGRTGEALSTDQALLITENAPASLLVGGDVVLTLDQGVKFQKGLTPTVGDYSDPDSVYGTELGFGSFSGTSTAANATIQCSVDAASSTQQGAQQIDSFSFDLTNASTGDLKVAVSGNAGASGSAKIAEIDYATSTKIDGSVLAVSPGATAVDIPDIIITETNAGALKSGYCALKFPDNATLDKTASVDVQYTDGTNSNTFSSSFDSGENNVFYFTVGAASSSGYIITISGLQAEIASGASGNLAFTIGGIPSTGYASDAFGSDKGAKPWSESVGFAKVVSATVPLVTLEGVDDGVLDVNVIPAGNNLGQIGDWYVFTSGATPKFYDGSEWTTATKAYAYSEELATKDFEISTDGLDVGTRIFVGYGVGVSSTFTNLNANGTFGLAYTVPEPSVFTVTPETADLEAGDSATITISGGNPSYTIESSDEDVATVDSASLDADGTVTVTVADEAEAGSTATITVTDSSDESKTVTVTVVSPDEFNLLASATTAATGETFTLEVKNGTSPFTFTASPSDAVTGLPDGEISETTVTVTAGTVSEDTEVTFTVTDSNDATDTVTVTVTASTTTEQPVPTEPTTAEVEGDDIAEAPVNMGTVTDGSLVGNMQLSLNFPAYDGEVDIYVLLAIPTDAGFAYFAVKPDGSLVDALGEEGIVAYAIGTEKAESATVFEPFPVCSPFGGGAMVPEGQWFVFYLVTPTSEGDINTALEGAYTLTFFEFTVSCE